MTADKMVEPQRNLALAAWETWERFRSRSFLDLEAQRPRDNRLNDPLLAEEAEVKTLLHKRTLWHLEERTQFSGTIGNSDQTLRDLARRLEVLEDRVWIEKHIANRWMEP